MNLVLAFADPQQGKPSVEEWKELLQPYNGMLVVVTAGDVPPLAQSERPGESVVKFGDHALHVFRSRPSVELGEWSHPYADPGNTACSQDALVKGPFEMQWFGPPGLQHVVDRCNRGSPPLFVGGRLFVPGKDRVTAVDAYNGTVLWERLLPGTALLAVSKNAPNLVAGKKHLYVARQTECQALDAATGQTTRTLKLPEQASADKEWGYLALCDDVLLGSVSKSDEARNRLVQNSWEQGFLDQQPQVVSEMLFARRPDTDSKMWDYCPRGGIVNTAVAAGNGHVYFIESDDPETREKHAGRVPLAKLLDGGAHLVALRLDTGHEAWRQPLKLKVRHCLFLLLSGNRLVLSGSRNEGATLVCDVLAHDADSGKELWTLSQPTGLGVGSIVSNQVQHPLVAGETVYLKTFACGLADGKVKKWGIPGAGCGALSASLFSTFYRSGAACYSELGEGRSRALTSGVTCPCCRLHRV